jgi:hypothetical protein
MTRIHWTNAVSADFGTAADWSGGVVPGRTDAAILDAAGAAFTVTASTREAVRSIQTAANATLLISSDTRVQFTAARGTGAGANAGTIKVVGPNANITAKLQVAGTIDNIGAVVVGDTTGVTGATGDLVVGTKGNPSLTLTGGGNLLLAANSFIEPCPAVPVGTVVTLTNVDNTISGAGAIGSEQAWVLTNEAAGVIDASAASQFTLFGTITNAGLVENTGSGTLVLDVATLDDTSGGTLKTGSQFAIADSTIIDAHLDFAAGATVDAIFTNNVLVTQTLTNQGFVAIYQNGALSIAGTIDNVGVIDNQGQLLFGPGASTLSGGGAIALESGFGAGIVGDNGATITNVDNTISGAGFIGLETNPCTLVNEAAGVIDANAGAALTVDDYSAPTQNAGLMEATGAGGLVIEKQIDNTGTIFADGGNVTVVGAAFGAGVAKIDNGTLNFESGCNEAVIFTGAAGELELAKSADYRKSITGFSLTGGTSLDLRDVGFVSAGEATYSGSATKGVLTVTDGTNTALIYLKGDYLGARFTASSDGHGGTSVVATSGGATSHRFAEAMAGFAPRSATVALVANNHEGLRQPMLAKPAMAA